jgi:hypothetical protein
MKAFALAVILAALAGTASSQTLGPIISEYSGKARGEFTVQNNSLTPVTVVLDPKSFSVTPDGKPLYRALDSSIKVKLDSMTARLGARQQHVFSYEIKCEQAPCWLTVYAAISGPHANAGIQTRILLPHTVYVCQRGQKACRSHVRRDVWGLKD